MMLYPLNMYNSLKKRMRAVRMILFSIKEEYLLLLSLSLILPVCCIPELAEVRYKKSYPSSFSSLHLNLKYFRKNLEMPRMFSNNRYIIFLNMGKQLLKEKREEKKLKMPYEN